MAELETLQSGKQEEAGADPGAADLMIAIPAPLGSEALSATVAKLAQASKMLSAAIPVVVALPGEEPSGTPVSLLKSDADPAAPALRVVHYPPPQTDAGAIPWLLNSTAYRNISTLANRVGARACTVLGTDLAFHRDALTAEKLTLLLDPAAEGNFDLVMPLYGTQALDNLVNRAILYPLTRALYGQRVRNPLGNELQMSAKLFSTFAGNGSRESARQQGRLPWPATVAASRNMKICQVHLGARQGSTADGIELSDALAQLAGSLFLDMEDNAVFWQRIRGSHEVPTFGAPAAPADTADSVDVRRMLEAFQLGVRNLREVWSLILPPLTLLELKKLSHLEPDDFHMEDALWARIVYDFALAHRLRNIHRGHMFGAFTPLYLGWVAAYAVDINRRGAGAAEERTEQLARAYEAEKPYLLSRWRWPDRFHP